MRLSAVLLLVLLLAPPLCRAADCLRLASIAEGPDADFDSALGEAVYREAGLCVSIQRLPTERVKRMLEAEQLDGVAMRTAQFIQDHANLVVVPTPLVTLDERVYWPVGRSKPPAGATIGIPRGWVVRRLEAERLGYQSVEVDSDSSLIKMAETGRLEGFLMSDFEFDKLTAGQASERRFASASIQVTPLYNAVTRAHADIVPRLDAAIQRLAARGDIERLLDHHRGM